jgi:hypothetical protein
LPLSDFGRIELLGYLPCDPDEISQSVVVFVCENPSVIVQAFPAPRFDVLNVPQRELPA